MFIFFSPLLQRIRDKKLKSHLQQQEKWSQQAAKSAAAAETLHQEDAGFLKVDGPLARTWKVKQRDLRDNVDVMSARNA